MEGKNIFLTGDAGTGKSYLMEALRNELEAAGIRYGITGTTGVAALNVGGSTIHSWSGLGMMRGTIGEIIEGVFNNTKAVRRIKETKVLVIEEVSMLSAEMLDVIDKVFKLVREVDEPFGGMQIVLVGDMLQLCPVNADFPFTAKAWEAGGFEFVKLNRIFRQEPGEFADVLNKLRRGCLDDAAIAFLKSRKNRVDPNPEIPPVNIVSTNEEADFLNHKMLEMIEGEKKRYHAVDSGTEAGLRLLEKSIIPKELDIKVGARVMCLSNLEIEEGVVNGSTGVVTMMGMGYAQVRFDNGYQKMIGQIQIDVVRDKIIIASRIQIPLRLAYAITTHKVQGLTLDKVSINLGRAFEPGMAYVALSRVRTPEGLFIVRINDMGLRPNQQALEFYRQEEDRQMLRD